MEAIAELNPVSVPPPLGLEEEFDQLIPLVPRNSSDFQAATCSKG